MNKSDTYSNTAHEAGTGNMNVDTDMMYTLTGAEADDTTIVMRRMHSKNTYLRMQLNISAALAASGTFDVGYVSRVDGVADDLDFFAAAVDLNSAATNGLLTIPVSPDVKVYDIALTFRDAGASGDAGKVITMVAEFTSSQG